MKRSLYFSRIPKQLFLRKPMRKSDKAEQHKRNIVSYHIISLFSWFTITASNCEMHFPIILSGVAKWATSGDTFKCLKLKKQTNKQNTALLVVTVVPEQVRLILCRHTDKWVTECGVREESVQAVLSTAMTSNFCPRSKLLCVKWYINQWAHA